MPQDRVLKCLIPVRLDGIIHDQVLDAVQDEGGYLVVLQWGEDEHGRRPRVFVAITAQDFEMVTVPECSHELVCATIIDLDNAHTWDVGDDLRSSFMPPPAA